MVRRLFPLLVTILMLPGCDLQNRMLYFPDAAAPSEDTLTRGNLTPWPSTSRESRGFVSGKAPTHPMGTIVIFHGNAGTAVDRAFYGEALTALGYRVILAEYPRYSGRQGALGETAFVADALETVRLAFTQFGGPLFLLGESLGCGVAAAAAKAPSVPIAGVILITPWETLAAVAQAKFPWLPVRPLLTDTYDTIGNLKAFPGRIAVVGAERDEVISLRHALTLYKGLPGPAKRLWILSGAGHNDWPRMTTPLWWQDLMDFISHREKG